MVKTTIMPSHPRKLAVKQSILAWTSGVALALWLGSGSWLLSQEPSVPLPGSETRVSDGPPSRDETPITVKELQTHASFLASDTLEGREAGSAGGRATAAYLADQLKQLGLQPLGSETDYRQPFQEGCQNVVGMLTGSDPVLKEEWIVIGAHFDHVGFGNQQNSKGPLGQIHNGADDNASGVSCLLEIAEALRGGPALKRSVVIAFWDAEEEGMLGSEHWLAHQANREKIRFYTNIDMVGRMQNDSLIVYGVRTMPGLRDMLTRSNISNLQFKFDWSQLNDSDHYTFFLRSIPYAMLFSGEHPDYHRPSDDVEKLNFEGMEKITHVLLQLTTELATTAEPQTFRDSSRYELTKFIPGNPLPSRLGVKWPPTRVRGEAITLTFVDPGLPADRAGMKVGDELRAINGKDVREIDNFIEAIRQSPKHVVVDLFRAKSQATELVTLDLDGVPLPAGSTGASDSAEPGIVIVSSVRAGSPAANAGFQIGDRIHSAKEGATVAERSWQIDRDGRLIRLPAP